MSYSATLNPAPLSSTPLGGLHSPADQKRKILLFYQDFGQMGGIERYLLRLGHWLQQHPDFEPLFVCCEGGRLYEALREAGHTVYGLPVHPVFGRSFLRSFDWSSLWRLRQIVQREKLDIAHVHIGLLETLLLRQWGCATVFTFHGYGSLYSGRLTRNPLKKLVKTLVQWAFRQTGQRLDALLMVSEAEQRRLLAEGFLTPAHAGQVLQNGVPVAALRQQAMNADLNALRLTLDLSPENRVITDINRLDANKNPAHFLALAQRFSQNAEFADCRFLVVGDGPLLAEVAQNAQQYSNVRVLGYRTDTAELLALTDALVYPALAEGFGLGLVEAMAVGVPVIAYASEGAGDILGTPETRACLVPVGDFEALATALEMQLRQSADQRHLLSEALKQRAEQFDESKTWSMLSTVYGQLTPKISILMPVYNGSDCVLAAIRSVLAQSYPHWELIVVDDGSTDETLARLSPLPEQDERIRVFSRVNQGVAATRNFAFSQANGDYIAFLDADDVWLVEKLATEVNVLRARRSAGYTDPCLIYSAYFAVDESMQLVNLPPIYQAKGELSEAVLAHEGIFLPSTALVHRDIFEAVGGFKTACYHEDRVFFIEACQHFPAYPTAKRLVLYRQALSGRCRSVLKDYEAARKAELSIVETLQGALSQQQLATLSIRQMRNLLFRFLMYNYTQQARRLHAEMRTQAADVWMNGFEGKKGILALVSLHSGINFLWVARLIVQRLMKFFSVKSPCRARL